MTLVLSKSQAGSQAERSKATTEPRDVVRKRGCKQGRIYQCSSLWVVLKWWEESREGHQEFPHTFPEVHTAATSNSSPFSIAGTVLRSGRDAGGARLNGACWGTPRCR